LFDSKLLPRLEGVGLINLSDCTPVLQTFLLSKKLNGFRLTNAKLKKSDFAVIAKMSRLTSLDLSGANIDDSDLKQLTMLRNISALNLSATSITKKSIPTLRRFSALHDPVLPPDIAFAYFEAL
jgi:Leucine-rich repeat (LRR) protein